MALKTFVAILCGFHEPPQVVSRLGPSNGTDFQASAGVNRTCFEESASAGAGTTVTEGADVSDVDVGYAFVVTPYGFMQYICWSVSLMK